eukprot:10897397-Lingulodinium_polyedra.AAC.1
MARRQTGGRRGRPRRARTTARAMGVFANTTRPFFAMRNASSAPSPSIERPSRAAKMSAGA